MLVDKNLLEVFEKNDFSGGRRAWSNLGVDNPRELGVIGLLENYPQTRGFCQLTETGRTFLNKLKAEKLKLKKDSETILDNET